MVLDYWFATLDLRTKAENSDHCSVLSFAEASVNSLRNEENACCQGTGKNTSILNKRARASGEESDYCSVTSAKNCSTVLTDYMLEVHYLL